MFNDTDRRFGGSIIENKWVATEPVCYRYAPSIWAKKYVFSLSIAANPISNLLRSNPKSQPNSPEALCRIVGRELERALLKLWVYFGAVFPSWRTPTVIARPSPSRDEMTLAPVVCLITTCRVRAAELKAFMENPTSFKMLTVVFNSRQRHRLSLRLQLRLPILPPPRDCVNNFGNQGVMNC
uniref:Uncharacterized protein n=1 Tax=Ananas comosus var. bracteatus TaxID=296719 RepID=A0A6V7PUI1_ANACO|nr:unnamed protein product [Ananas comosus var. bracteatus]